MFYTWGCLDHPHICMPTHTFVHPHMFLHPQGCTHPKYAPILFCASIYICAFLEALHVVGGCNGLPFVLRHLAYITPVWWCLPFNYTPCTQLLVPCVSVCFRDISRLCGHFLLLKGLGVLPPSVGGLVHQHLRCPYAHSGKFFVVHYVSHFDYGSNHYSSGYGGIFWLVFSVISDSGSFPDRVSSKLGSAWHGSTTTLDAKRL